MPAVKSPKSKPKRAADLSEVAFQRLMRAIVSGELKEGERVKESRIAEEWGIGITPIREAVRRMGAMGYLVLKPNFAPVVRKLTADDIVQIYSVREALESLALATKWDAIKDVDLQKLRKLAKKGESCRGKARFDVLVEFDEALHRLWTTETNNPWLDSSLERIVIYLPGLSRALSSHQEHVEIAFNEHKLILKALEERDRAKASKLLGDHISHAGAVLAELLRDRE